MKQFFATLLFVLYTIATSGAIVKMHYCGKELESIKISLKEDLINKSKMCCDVSNDHCSILETETNCCNDSLIPLKINNDYNYSFYTTFLDGNYTPCYPIFFPRFISLDYFTCDFCICSKHSTAPLGLWQSIPLYILLNQNKIYDYIV